MTPRIGRKAARGSVVRALFHDKDETIALVSVKGMFAWFFRQNRSGGALLNVHYAIGVGISFMEFRWRVGRRLVHWDRRL